MISIPITELEAMERRFKAMQRAETVAKAQRFFARKDTKGASNPRGKAEPRIKPALQTKAVKGKVAGPIGYEPARLALQAVYDGIAAQQSAR